MKIFLALLDNPNGEPVVFRQVCGDSEDITDLVGGDKVLKKTELPISPRILPYMPTFELISQSVDAFGHMDDEINRTIFEWGRQHEREHPRKGSDEGI